MDVVEAYLQFVEKRGLLHGRFDTVRRIGATGGGGYFSLVFTARDTTTNNEVVLKFFRPDRLTPGDAYRWDSFERESKILTDLSGSRDIIQLVAPQQEFIERPVPNVPFEIRFAYYAMEKGVGTLEDIIEGDTCSEEELLLHFRSAVRATQRIHAKSVAHRDIKPSNFLETATGLKLSDFGTARIIAGGNNSLLLNYIGPVGDLNYAAPEIMACLHDCDPTLHFTSDFFSLGAVLFEMFTRVKLGITLFGPQLLTSLNSPMVNVPRDQRVKIFTQVIPAVSAKYPLPLLQSLNPDLRGCIRVRLNELFRALTNLDYRRRLTQYPAIFRSIDTCLLILRNEARIDAWQAEKQKRRAIRMQKTYGARK